MRRATRRRSAASRWCARLGPLVAQPDRATGDAMSALARRLEGRDRELAQPAIAELLVAGLERQLEGDDQTVALGLARRIDQAPALEAAARRVEGPGLEAENIEIEHHAGPVVGREPMNV